MNNKSTSSINEALRNQRLLRGWSQKDVADQLGTTTVTVNRWERGSQQPSPVFRFKLSTLYGKSEAELGLLPTEQTTNDLMVSTPLSENIPAVSQEHTSIEQVTVIELVSEESQAAIEKSIDVTIPLRTKISSLVLHPQQSRRFAFILFLISLISLVISIVIGTSLIFTSQLSAQKTMTTFCQALVEKDFDSAYDQFSPQLQQQVPKSEITKPYSACTTAPSIVSDARPRCTLLLTTNMNIKYWRLISLSLDKQHQWKIDSWGASHKG
jgi:transcriptional regulator with XRE-family HTH domain